MEFNHPLFQTRAGIDAAGSPSSRPAQRTLLWGTDLRQFLEVQDADGVDLRPLRPAEPTVAEMAELVRLQLAMGNGQTIARAERRKSLTDLPAQKAA